MTERSNPFIRAIARVVSRGAWLSEALRRARYKRADLSRIPAVEMVSPAADARGTFSWIPDFDVRGVPHAALKCSPGSQIAYDVNLPGAAQVRSWCAVASTNSNRKIALVFEVVVRTQTSEVSARRIVRPSESRVGRQWRALRLHVREGGPARIVLRTNAADEPVLNEPGALWGDPHIELRRSAVELVSTVLTTLSQRNLRNLWHRAFPADERTLYTAWLRQTGPSHRQLEIQREWARARAFVFSLITVVPELRHWRPRATSASLFNQTYPAWEWILVAPVETIRELEASTAIPRDTRIRFVPVPSGTRMADAWNAGLQTCRGGFAALLNANDTLSSSALYEVANALEGQPDCDVLYSDEDCMVGDTQERYEPRFKPDWSPELLLSLNYIGRLAMMRVATAIAAGGFRDGFESSVEWELFLRLSRSGARFRRVPRCLYHRSETAAAATQSQEAEVLRDHCEALGWPVTLAQSGDAKRLAWDVTGLPLVSVVIPNRNAAAVLEQCVKGILEDTSYRHLELIIVDNASTETDVLDFYRSIEGGNRGRVVPFDRPFNFSAACNLGASAASGDYLLFLNNDIEVIQPDWLEELLRWAQRPEIGVVGAKLLYPDRLIQHAGVVFGLGLVGHIFARAPETASGVFGSPESYRNYLAVTGACQMIRKSVFRQLGGYDERFRVSFSDVVLCMEAWKVGYRVVYTPYARLIHHESFTRGRRDAQDDVARLARYLQASGFVEDPYFHPELDPKSPVPAVRPPFDPAPREIVAESVRRAISAAEIFAERSERR